MTNGLSPKLKLAALLASVATAIVTLLAVLFPETVTSEVAAAVTGAIVTISAAVGAYLGSPGDVTQVVGDPSDGGLGDEAKDLLRPVEPGVPQHAQDA